MIDVALRKEKKKKGVWFWRGQGVEAEGMLGGARVKLIQCRMKGSFEHRQLDPPQSESE